MPETIDLLLRAAAKGQVDAVQELLALAPQLVNSTGPHPYWGGRPNPLQVAAEWGRAEVVKALLARGADPNADSSGYDGWTPLHCAIRANHPDQHEEVRRLLIEAGAAMDACAASAMNDIGRLGSMSPAELLATGPNGGTALHFAASAEVAALLIENGVDPQLRDKYGRTALQAIAHDGDRHKDAAMFLIAVTGELDFFLACSLGLRTDAVRFLDADPGLLHAPLANGEGALNRACACGQEEIVRLLLDRGADANLPTGGEYPIHNAARFGHVGVARLLLDRGANAKALDAHHQATPVDWANFHGHSEMAEFLAAV